MKNRNNKNENDKKYRQVCAALAYFLRIEHENQRKEESRRKAQKFLSTATLVGSIALLALNLVTQLNFDISWMASFAEWFSEMYVSLMIYTFLTALVLFFEKKLKFDQNPVFGYVWPFAGFFISLFMSKTIKATLVPASFNFIIGSIAIGALLGYLWLSSFIQIGKEKGEKELAVAKKAAEILEENPSVVEDVLRDFENDYKKQKETSSKEQGDIGSTH